MKTRGMKKTALALALTGAVGMMAAGQANATVYASSRLLLTDLSIVIQPFDFGPGPIGTAPITSYKFDAFASSDLNGVSGGGKSSTCSGSLTAPASGNCADNTFTGSGTAAVLGNTTDTATSSSSGNNTASAPGGARSEDTYTFLGPNATDEYGTADSVISDAELVGDATTKTSQISEAQIQTTSQSASGSTTVGSTTGFTINFSVGDDSSLTLDFLADPDLVALINDLAPGLLSASASSRISLSVNISSTDANGIDINWAPQGNAANNCGVDGEDFGGSVTCDETDDAEDLNRGTSTSYPPNVTQNDFSTSNALHNGNLIGANSGINGAADLGFSAFGIYVPYLPSGTYSITLTAQTFSSVSRAAVPEPSILALLGLGMAGLGFAGRRRKFSKA